MSGDQGLEPGTRRFGDLPAVAMDSVQRNVNDRLVEYLHPEKAGTGATIGGPMSALLRSPNLAEAVGKMVPIMFDGLSIPRTAMELAVLLTARHWNCHFEFDVHRRHAVTAGLSPETIEYIAHGHYPRLSDELEATYTFVMQLLRDGDVEDDAFASVTRLWEEQGAVELIATVGFYSMLAMVLNVDRYPPAGLSLPHLASGPGSH
ncbi:carboxymuconolactone decarboxylase family protein [Nocardia nova]|uniref:carboxymuconolactone decarboxylase family protein n=1 Tax=Nocardia nova TaxID=37330 RepID=UPI0007A55AE7|nr:hypothetical protein [Nocardia nova]